MEDVAGQLPNKMEFGEYTAWIFKPIVLIKCMHCGESGHKKNDNACPALAPMELMMHIIPF